MFPLHDRLRRRICIAGFLLFCVVPTLAVLGWAAAWSLPSHVRAEARQIARQLGMEVFLGRVEHLRPGAVRLRHVVLRDCEQPEAVLRCDVVDAELKNLRDAAGTPRRVLILRAPAVEIDPNRLTALGELARRLLELRAGNLDVDLRCAAATIHWHCPGPAPGTFTDVRGAVQTVDGGTEAWLKFRVSGQNGTRPALLRLGRNRQLQPPADWFALDTGGAELPCTLLGRGIPAMRSLGANARFRGCLWAESTHDGWHGEIGSAAADQPPSEFLDVDLDRLVTNRSPHTLSGKARVVLGWASFRANRLEKAYGGVSAGPGTVSASLLSVATEYLGLEQTPEPAPRSDPVAYDALAFRFELDDRGLAIKQWWSDRDGVIVAGRHTLLAPTGLACLPVALVRAMAPPEKAVYVPATHQTEWLLLHLPLPEVAPPGTTRQRQWQIATDPKSEGPSK